MTVGELIKALQDYPEDLPVCYSCCSEYVALEASQLDVLEACEQRADGWVHDKRPDKPTRKYLAFPGN